MKYLLPLLFQRRIASVLHVQTRSKNTRALGCDCGGLQNRTGTKRYGCGRRGRSSRLLWLGRLYTLAEDNTGLAEVDPKVKESSPERGDAELI
jgi:hypothetical protein